MRIYKLSFFIVLCITNLNSVFAQKKVKLEKANKWVMSINEKGEEITTMVRWEDQFFSSHDIILHNRPSRFYYQALEKTELLVIDYDLAQEIMKRNPKLEQGRKHFLLGMLKESIERVESFTLHSPEERYMEFIKEKPDIVNRVPDKYIATILGMTPVSLSRIRKRIAIKEMQQAKQKKYPQ